MWHKLFLETAYWLQVFLLPVYWLSFAVPRDCRIWLFGSTFGRRFADNPRYLYLYLNHYHNDKIRPIWITRKKDVAEFLTKNGCEAYYYYSLKGFCYCLRGGLYIFDNYSKDISFWLSGGAIKINLWHGVGNKKINYDNKFDRVRHPKNNWEKISTYLRRLSDEKPEHYILATSPLMAGIFQRAFRSAPGHVIIAGYPRNDALFFKEYTATVKTPLETKVLSEISKHKKLGKKLFFYMPTFRESETLFLKVMNLKEFNRFLEENDFIFVMKLHPKSKLKQIFHQMDYSSMMNIDADTDAYLFLGHADVLVTDYSSVYSDYLLLNRPAIGFFYDYEEYRTNTREGYFDFEQYMPEVKAGTMPELMAAMKAVLESDRCRERRQISRDRLFSKAGADAGMDVTNEIIKRLKQRRY